MHAPAVHASVVQSFPSLVHDEPSPWWFGRHTPPGLQVLGSSQSDDDALPQALPAARLVCVHAPAVHASVVQSFPSLAHEDPSARWLGWHTPPALHVSGSSQPDDAGSPHALPAGRFVCVHTEPEQTSAVQGFPSLAQEDPSACVFGRQTPLSLHVSGSSQLEDEALPQALPAGRFACVHTDPEQTSAVQGFPSLVQDDPSAWVFGWHAPLSSHVSGPSQSEDEGSPHAVPAGRFVCAHTDPEQTSAVQGFPSLVHGVPSGRAFGSHTPPALHVSLPLQSPARALPHEVPAGRFACAQTAPAHASLVQSLPSLVHDEPAA